MTKLPIQERTHQMWEVHCLYTRRDGTHHQKAVIVPGENEDEAMMAAGAEAAELAFEGVADSWSIESVTYIGEYDERGKLVHGAV